MELLKQLYSIHSMSGQENAMRAFIKKYVKGMPGDISVRQDHGNIYITKGVSESYPCLIAHLDQVQRLHSADFRTFESGGKLFGFSLSNSRLEGLGADDKNGIWIALKTLETAPALKIAFFKEEEVGCGGSEIADMSFFRDCRYCLQADRRNGGDFITDICGPLCSKEFIEDVRPLMNKYGYKETSGMMTDVLTLVDNNIGISCVNMSCGYYNPHTDHESTDIKELLNALAFVKEIVSSLGKVYAYTPPVSPHWSKGWYGYDAHYSGALARDYSHYDYEEVSFVPRLGDYNDPAMWLEDFITANYGIDPADLYPYIRSDWEDTLGLTIDDYYENAYDILEELYSMDYPGYDDSDLPLACVN